MSSRAELNDALREAGPMLADGQLAPLPPARIQGRSAGSLRVTEEQPI